MDIFRFSNYEDFFQSMADSHHGDRGYRTRLAAAAKVHPSYITRIIQGTVSITPDQAAAFADFWNLSASEKEYFLWLVLKGRSSDASMKKLADEKLAQLRAEYHELENALPAEKINPSEENEYYMNWIYSAVHVFSTLQKSQTPEQIASRLGLSTEVVSGAIQVLIKLGLVELHKGKILRAQKNNVHLSNRSWMAPLQHRNWRIASVDRISRPSTSDVRYTGVHSISKKDLEKLRQQIRDFLIQTDKLVRPSAEETVCVLCLDLFEL
jgi:uncharacterized protein (TIGR02147 family)